jgi:ABC-type transport system involved in multi-copper enzyme maturation permease subunit
MFWKVLSAEQVKLFKRNILWIEMGLLALAVAALYLTGFAILLGGSSGELPPELIENGLTWPAGLTGALSFAAGPNLGGILMIVLVGAAVAQEYTWGTLQLWLSRGIPRPLFMGAKFASLLLPAALIVLTALFTGGLISGAFSLHFLGSIPFTQVEWGQLGWSILVYTYSLLPYAALTFFLAVASRSTVVSIGGGLAYALLLEGIGLQLIGTLGGIWGEIGRFMPGGLARGMLSLNSGITVEVGGEAVESIEYLNPGTAAIAIAIYILIFVTGAILVFRRQDLNV